VVIDLWSRPRLEAVNKNPFCRGSPENGLL
jgi:hypothetical protein